jgi:hypothetical protein
VIWAASGRFSDVLKDAKGGRRTMTNTSFTRLRSLTAALAVVASLMAVTDALSQSMGPGPGPGPDPRAAAYAPQGGGRSDYAYDRRVGRGYGDRGPSRARYRHRRARAHPVHPRPECELGLHGCLGRDGLYHGKF